LETFRPSSRAKTLVGERKRPLERAPTSIRQAEADALEADLEALNNLIDQVCTLLISIDAKAGPLDDKNISALRTLSGLLKNAADKSLLAQITGPTAQAHRPAPATP
jgi:hypothetical protein